MFVYLLMFAAGDKKAYLHSASCWNLAWLLFHVERKSRKVRLRVVFPLFLWILIEWSSQRERTKITGTKRYDARVEKIWAFEFVHNSDGLILGNLSTDFRLSLGNLATSLHPLAAKNWILKTKTNRSPKATYWDYSYQLWQNLWFPISFWFASNVIELQCSCHFATKKNN